MLLKHLTKNGVRTVSDSNSGASSAHLLVRLPPIRATLAAKVAPAAAHNGAPVVNIYALRTQSTNCMAMWILYETASRQESKSDSLLVARGYADGPTSQATILGCPVVIMWISLMVADDTFG